MNGLIDDIAKEYGIKRGLSETKLSWFSRVIYSLSGQAGYSSLWDFQEDSDPPNELHFKQRVRNIYGSFTDIYPGIRVNFPDINNITEEIYRLMSSAGYIWRKGNRVCAPLYRTARGGKYVFVRGHAPGEKISVSGLGCYIPAGNSSHTDCTLSEMFGLYLDDENFPAVKYYPDGETVKMTLKNFPYYHKNFLELFTWPTFPHSSHRIMNADIFTGIKNILESKGCIFERQCV